jgi:hypothetical protein
MQPKCTFFVLDTVTAGARRPLESLVTWGWPIPDVQWRRYVLDMRVAPEQRDAIVALVQRVAPGAVASERGGHHVSFSLPPQSLDIPTLFEQARARAVV